MVDIDVLRDNWEVADPPRETIDLDDGEYLLVPFPDYSEQPLSADNVEIALDLFVYATGQRRTDLTKDGDRRLWMDLGLASSHLVYSNTRDFLNARESRFAVFEVAKSNFREEDLSSSLKALFNSNDAALVWMVERYAPCAPPPVKRQAIHRLAEWFAQRGPTAFKDPTPDANQASDFTLPTTHDGKIFDSANNPNPMRSSGAEYMLAPFRNRGALIIGDNDCD